MQTEQFQLHAEIEERHWWFVARRRIVRRLVGRAGTDFWMPPGPLNRLLEATFAGEARVLEGVLEGRRAQGYRKGASLVALLRREPGRIVKRNGSADSARPRELQPVPESRRH